MTARVTSATAEMDATAMVNRFTPCPCYVVWLQQFLVDSAIFFFVVEYTYILPAATVTQQIVGLPPTCVNEFCIRRYFVARVSFTALVGWFRSF